MTLASASGAFGGDGFGSSVSWLSANILAVGAYRDNTNRPGTSGNDKGAVYICVRPDSTSTDWQCEKPGPSTTETVDVSPIKIADSIPGLTLASVDRFGSSVSWLDADTLAVGAFGDDTNRPGTSGGGKGAVYICEKKNNAWDCDSGKIADGDAGLTLTANDGFGTSVSWLDADTLAVGAFSDDTNRPGTSGGGKGAVYICEKKNNAWDCDSGKIADGDAGLTLAGGDWFGASVSWLDADTLAVAAENDGTNRPGTSGGGKGAVYICEKKNNAWDCDSGKIADGDAGLTLGTGDIFGTSVSWLDADTLAVGASGDDTNRSGTSGSSKGAVYICEKKNNAWDCDSGKIADGDAGLTLASVDRFGSSVSWLDADTLAVGAFGDDTNRPGTSGGGKGAVYICEKKNNAWDCDSGKIADGDAGLTLASNDRFGSSVSWLSANILAVGADGDKGAVYICTRPNATSADWQCGKPRPVTPTGINFGSAVAPIDTNTIAVGAYGNDDTGGANRGAVYICTKSGNSWSCPESSKIAHDGTKVNIPTNGNQFGSSVARLNTTTLAVGAWGDNTGGANRGCSIHLYTTKSATSTDWSCPDCF